LARHIVKKQLWLFDYGNLLSSMLDSIANFVYAEVTLSIGRGKLPHPMLTHTMGVWGTPW